MKVNDFTHEDFRELSTLASYFVMPKVNKAGDNGECITDTFSWTVRADVPQEGKMGSEAIKAALELGPVFIACSKPQNQSVIRVDAEGGLKFTCVFGNPESKLSKRLERFFMHSYEDKLPEGVKLRTGRKKKTPAPTAPKTPAPTAPKTPAPTAPKTPAPTAPKTEKHREEEKAPKTETKIDPEVSNWAQVLTTLTRENMGLAFYGPAGTGKTYTAQQIAKELGVPCYLQGKVSHSSELKGFIDAQGKFHETPLYKAFVNGGVLVIDEFDSWDTDVITAINAALAQREFEFACGQKTAHEKTMFIATQNTHFGGFEGGYCRQEMDLSTVNRFVYFKIEYPEDLEKKEFGSELANFVRECRSQLIASEVKGIITLRNLFAYRALLPLMGKEVALRNGLLSTIADADTVERFYLTGMKKNF